MTKLFQITGKAISGDWGDEDPEGTGVPVLRTANFTNEGVFDFTDLVTRQIQKRNLSEKLLRKGDIVIEKSGGSDKFPVGRVVFFDGEEGTYLFNNFTGLLRVKDPEKWFPRYIFYALFASYRNGGTRPYENRTTGLHNLQTDAYLNNLDVPDRDCAHQRRVCCILDTTQKILHQRRAQLAALDELVKARFVEMFGDPAGNPMGWPTKPLLAVGDCKNGMNFHREESGVEIHCLGVGDFQNHSVFRDTTVFPLVSLNEMPSKEFLLQDGDIVFVRSNGNKALVGRSVAVYPGSVPTTFSGFCIRFRPSQTTVNTTYLLRVLKTDSMRAQMAGRGANIQNLNQQILSTLKIPLPPLSLQARFASFVARVEKLKASIQRSLAETQRLFDSQLQEHFG